MRRFAVLAVVIAAVSAVANQPALAVTIGFSPASQTVGPGDPVLVEVVVSDLGGEIVSAYDLDVTYDASVLSATGVTFGLLLGDELLFEVLNASDVSVPGLVDFAQVSLLSDAELAALQSDPFTLATLEFDAIGVGTSPLVFDAFNDITGRNALVLDVDPESGSVTVIPEPHSALVFALGAFVVGTAVARKRPRRGL
jgi:hypothetical protein